MNERIDKLFSDAIELTIKDPRDLRGEDWDNECRKKFAELIVRECIDVVDVGGEFVSRPKMVERMKQHFGVEE